jgi:hypothetical protein
VFTCEITDDFDFSAFVKNDEAICIVPIGHVDQKPVSLLTALSPTPGHFPDGFELIFVIVVDAGKPDKIEYYDGKDTLGLIADRDDRATICRALRSTVNALIDVIEPKLVSMTTHSAHLPEKALRKFHDIAVLFRDRGYQSGPADSYHGRLVWMMERQ